MKTDTIQVRRALESDASALSAIFRDAWSLAYVGIIPHTHLQTLIRHRNSAWWRETISKARNVMVLEVEGVVGGYVTAGKSRWPLPQKGEIYELYLSPPYQGLGLGEHLFESGRHALDMRQLSGLVVWSLAQNEPACRFYGRRGGRPIAKSMEVYGPALVPKIAFAWS